jgi:hypothetical protein
LKFLPLFLKKFEDFCKILHFFEGIFNPWISPSLLVRVTSAFFLVTPAKECHPWPFPLFSCVIPAFLLSSQRKLGSTRRRRGGCQISPFPYLFSMPAFASIQTPVTFTPCGSRVRPRLSRQQI